MYITDWFSTLLGLAEVPVPPDTDSLDLWPALSRCRLHYTALHCSLHRGRRSPRKEIVLNLDQDNYRGLWSAAIRSGNYKLIWGRPSLLKAKVQHKAQDSTIVCL